MTIDPTLPEVVRNFLASGKKLEEIRLHADGRWTHEGLDFENPKIIDLFHRSVGRTTGGTWILEIGRFTYPIVVDDCGFFVKGISLESDPPMLRLSDDTHEQLDADSLTYEPDAKLYCDVKGGEFRARFLRAPYLEFADTFEERGGEIFWGDVKLV